MSMALAHIHLIVPAAVFLATLSASIMVTHRVVRALERRAILDYPTGRSSHSTPTPRGGGLAIIPIVMLVWAGIATQSGTAWAGPATPPLPHLAWVLAAAAGLSAISLYDDVSGLGAGIRLLAHITAVTVAISMAPAAAPYFQGLLPPWLDLLVAGIVWVWFINLFNFMDGIDGIAGAETAAIGLGIAAVAGLAGMGAGFATLGVALAAAGLGFLVWNWDPARVFLGDVGSIPLGFLAGWLLLEMASWGLWAPALIIPGYYLADSTITLFRRGARGQRLWEAHRDHFYQLAVRHGWRHSRVVIVISLANLVLIGFAVSSLDLPPWPPLIASAVVIVALLAGLGHWSAAGGGRE
jgi:UDP-N-acetylmuramyl pentapeptide phosphotransferase/UDP-N-acetylglucosamine-1-phosphate transferase